jgi:hypothetical protein
MSLSTVLAQNDGLAVRLLVADTAGNVRYFPSTAGGSGVGGIGADPTGGGTAAGAGVPGTGSGGGGGHDQISAPIGYRAGGAGGSGTVKLWWPI